MCVRCVLRWRRECAVCDGWRGEVVRCLRQSCRRFHDAEAGRRDLLLPDPVGGRHGGDAG